MFYMPSWSQNPSQFGEAMERVWIVHISKDMLVNKHRVTMVLADNPKNRSMCPVTLLLAQAIKDGVIDGVDRIHDLSSVAKNHWPAWTTLPYRPGMSDLPILRRTKTAARYIMSLHPIKPSALDKMVRAQIRRAGHELTFTTILDDNKRAAHIFRRERKSMTL